MEPSTRRAILTGVGVTFSGGLAGCVTGDEQNKPAESSSVSATSERDEFENLSTDGMPTECPQPDYAYHAVTPVPYPTPSVPDDADSVVKLAAGIEAAYLDNWVVLNYDPLDSGTTTPDTPTPSHVDYPDVAASYETRTVLQETENGVVTTESAFVVHLRYERLVAGDVEGRYTVNYYLAESAVARAEAEGYGRPGPHPTDEGVLLSC